MKDDHDEWHWPELEAGLRIRPIGQGARTVVVSRRVTASMALLVGLAAGCAPTVISTPGTAEMPRTVTVSALDSFAFDPARIQVQAGETIRFVVTNDGVLEHEFAIGSRADLQAHAQVMIHGGMREDTPAAVRLLPGQTKELVHTFGSDPDIGYGCFVIGHYPKGMSGDFEIVD